MRLGGMEPMIETNLIVGQAADRAIGLEIQVAHST